MRKMRLEGFGVEESVQVRSEGLSSEAAVIYAQINALDLKQRVLLVQKVLPAIDAQLFAALLEKNKSDNRLSVITLRLEGKKTSLSLPRSVSDKAKAQLGPEVFTRFITDNAAMARSLGAKNKSGYVVDKLMEILR